MRVSSGAKDLDALLEGGFPRGSVIVVAGNPGTGKTVFCMNFICHGAEKGENGIFVSFSEDKETLISNTSRHLGYDVEKMCKEGKIEILDLVLIKKVSKLFESIFREVLRKKAKRLVIDSFTAMSQVIGDVKETRIVLQTALSRISRRKGLTTLLTVEVPAGETRIGTSIEEFAADGLILLSKEELEGRTLRRLEVKKLRGTLVRHSKYIFTLKGGFKVIVPRRPKHHGVLRKERKRLPNTKDRFSSGIWGLDNMLGGGFERGSVHLYEADVPEQVIWGILGPTIYNFVVNGGGVMILPWMGYPPSSIAEACIQILGRESVEKQVRILGFHASKEQRPYIVKLSGRDLQADFRTLRSVRHELDWLDGKRPTLAVVSLDTLLASYPAWKRSPELFMSFFNLCMTFTASGDALDILVFKKGFPDVLKQRIRDFSSTHVKILSVDGIYCAYGVKPWTNMHVIQKVSKEGESRLDFLEIV